jgi:hypothetical protein
LNLTNVPSEVQCLRITASNSVRTVERDIPLSTSTGGTGGVSNVADETPLEGLPTGDVTVSANAYNVICENVVSSTIPTWKSYPLTQVVEIVEGVPYAWELVLRPNGYVVPAVDWEGDEVVNEYVNMDQIILMAMNLFESYKKIFNHQVLNELFQIIFEIHLNDNLPL